MWIKDHIYDIVICFFYSVQMLMLMSGSTVRYSKYKDVGRYSLNVARPWRYKLKLLFHALILILFFLMTLYFALNYPKRDLRDQLFRITMCLTQIVAWILSSSMMLFEYKRALGHVWYVHPLFWWFSVVAYEADVTLWRTEKGHTK